MSRAAIADPREIVSSAAAGDEVAFSYIVAEHHEDMRRVCAFVARDDAIAEEAVQAAWSIAWRKLRSLRDPGHLRPWLMRVAINEAKALIRRDRRRAVFEVAIDASVGLAEVERPTGTDPATGIDVLDLRSAMASLDPDDRALLALRYGAGFDATELSRVLGLSPSGTRTRLERLLKRLQQELRDD